MATTAIYTNVNPILLAPNMYFSGAVLASGCELMKLKGEDFTVKALVQ